MISGGDLYTVLSAVVPLYVAMFLAYGSVRWWKIFSPEQCAGINRFVAIFAVPLLSFEVISKIDPYRMNFQFIAADGISKVMVLLVLAVWAKCSQRGSLDWVITLFSLSTLPNTLVMGIPLLKAMYGDSADKLMIQAVVLQCIIWYTMLLFLFEYRSAKKLVAEQYLNCVTSHAGASNIVQADQSDVLPVDVKDQQLETDDKVNINHNMGDGEKGNVMVRKPSLSSNSQGFDSAASSRRFQDLNYSKPLIGTAGCLDILSSVQSSTDLQIPNMDSSFNREEFVSRMSSAEMSPRGCNNDTNDNNVSDGSSTVINLDRRTNYSNGHVGLSSPNAVQLTKIVPDSRNYSPKFEDDAKELHMFVWSSGNSTTSEGMSEYDRGQSWEEADFHEDFNLVNKTPMAVQGELPGEKEDPNLLEIISRSTATHTPNPTQLLESGGQAVPGLNHKPSAAVMVKLILDMVCHKLVRNPNSYASVIGMMWALASCRWNFEMPLIVEGSITILSHAGLGMAMFSLGLFMALQPRIIACGTSIAAIGMVLRFLAGPAVMAIASIAVGLRSTVLHVSIVQGHIWHDCVFANNTGVLYSPGAIKEAAASSLDITSAKPTEWHILHPEKQLPQIVPPQHILGINLCLGETQNSGS